ncbi:trypsin-like peptidase domain-containing protein [Fontisphaera persica]|uniref:trypsin-like peptidase domain-containing protein n=1 Tax=Fontisphaera persica TaxID=2974023 RepID=UPI0024BF12B7|nr:trypsin-like peptidase domain-containing protein [Fontisphaera persica]WCJ60635.1 trypsin-like peptidase domain-containing protein [Fontisphaera persica]
MQRNAWFGLTWLATSLMLMPLHAAEDVRRDATVIAIEKVMPAVVNIATETVVPTRHPLEDLLREFYDPYYRRMPQRQYSLGSGVVIDEEGYVLTNDHVVRRASRIMVRFADNREYECDRVVTSTKSDVALLKIRAKPGERFAAVRFAADDDLLLGETVIALGNPFGLGGSVSRGILSSKNRRPLTGNEPMDVADWLQTDAAINPGNSGGPLVNLRGELIGINVAVYREGQGIGFAIPIKMVSEALSESFTPENLKGLWFGARVKPGAYPLAVTNLMEGSPAAKAGLKEGDQILAVDGQPVHSFIEFNRLLLRSGEEREVPLRVKRGRVEEVVRVRLIPEKSFFNEKLIERHLGATLQEMTPEMAQRWGLQSGSGLWVAAVEKDGPAERAGLERGMIVLAVEEEAVGDVVTTAKILHSRKAGDSLSLQLLVPRRRGSFLTIQQAVIKVRLR